MWLLDAMARSMVFAVALKNPFLVVAVLRAYGSMRRILLPLVECYIPLIVLSLA